MSAVAQLPAPPPAPDTPRAAPTTPTRLGRVLNVLRKLIDYGKQLATTVQQHAAAAPGFTLFARPFGTADIATILARITNGLRRAAALEAALLQRAAQGQDLTPVPLRLSAATPRPARQSAPSAAQPKPQPAAPTQDPRLARLPTEAQIAADVRRRPIGAVIIDICRDLGVTPAQFDREFWNELACAIGAYGGNLASFLSHLNKLLSTFLAGKRAADRANRATSAPPPRLPALATGPP